MDSTSILCSEAVRHQSQNFLSGVSRGEQEVSVCVSTHCLQSLCPLQSSLNIQMYEFLLSLGDFGCYFQAFCVTSSLSSWTPLPLLVFFRGTLTLSLVLLLTFSLFFCSLLRLVNVYGFLMAALSLFQVALTLFRLPRMESSRVHD